MAVIQTAFFVTIITKVFFGTSFGEKSPEPVLFLPLNKQYGTRDISKSNLPTTAVGVTLSPGPYGRSQGSYYFPGSSSSYIDVSKDPKIDTRYSMTVSFWVSIQNGTTFGPIVHYDTQNSFWGYHIYDYPNGNVFFRHMKRTKSFAPSIATNTLKHDSWGYVAHTYDYKTGIQKVYMDGIEIDKQDIGIFELNTDYKIKIGGQRYGENFRFFKGKISCLQIYDKVLSGDQILAAQSYCHKNDFPEPVLFLPLNKQYGTRDISKSNLPTTAVGVTLSPGPDGKPDGSYYFDGSSSYIDVPKHQKTDTRYSITVSAWVYNQGVDGPLLYYDTEAASYAAHFYLSGSTSDLFLLMMKRNLDAFPSSIRQPLSPVNSWKYFVYKYNYNTGIQKLYIDEVEIKSEVVGKFEIATQYKIKIGGQKSAGDTVRSIKGRISCIQIYDQALDRDQILEAKRYCSRNDLYQSCFHYESLSDPSRSSENKLGSQLPSDGKTLSRTHWYRLTGKRIRSFCPELGSCGAQTPGWLNGTYPTLEDGIKKIELCYRTAGSNCCASKVNVFVRQCYGYYVFKFDDFPTDGRFCTEKDPGTFNDVMFMSTYEQCLMGHVFHNETDVTDASRCIGYCLSAGSNCKSVNFINEEGGKCQLNNAVKDEGQLNMDSKCTYYEMI